MEMKGHCGPGAAAGSVVWWLRELGLGAGEKMMTHPECGLPVSSYCAVQGQRGHVVAMLQELRQTGS